MIQSQLSHPNVVGFKGICFEREIRAPGKLCLVSEYCAGEPMREVIQRSDVRRRLQMLLDVANGMEYIHSMVRVGEYQFVMRNLRGALVFFWCYVLCLTMTGSHSSRS